jgi:hypothetical protein
VAILNLSTLLLLLLLLLLMLAFLLKFTLVPNSALLFLKLLVSEFRLGISETSGYSALVPHANTVPLLDLRQLLMTVVRMLTYSRSDMFF